MWNREFSDILADRMIGSASIFLLSGEAERREYEQPMKTGSNKTDQLLNKNREKNHVRMEKDAQKRSQIRLIEHLGV